MIEDKRAVLLEVRNLSVSFSTPYGEAEAVRDVSFSLKPGETLALVGESGCGKSVLCKSIMKLLPSNGKIKAGNIFVQGIDITDYREQDMQRLRGKLFSMVFQDPMTSLNPAMTVGAQIAEAVKVCRPGISRTGLQEKVIELLQLVGIERPEERRKMYPHQFSGGMRQRSVLAVALAGNPAVLFADEPTTALDVTIQDQILRLFRDIQKKSGAATVFVTHDLGVAERVADRIAVMYAGKIVETGTAAEIFGDPRHPYTWGLMRALPAFAEGKESLFTIPGMPPSLINPPKGDAFACRNEYALAIDYEKMPPMFPVTDTHYAATWLLDKRAPKIPAFERRREKQNLAETEVQTASAERNPEVLLEVKNLSYMFSLTGKTAVKALDGLSFQIRRGEIFGLVGESGCGKSTAARCVMNLYRPGRESIFYKGLDIGDPKVFHANRRMLRTSRQIIFQNSNSSLNQRMKVCDIIAEPMKIHRITPPRGSYRAEAEFQLHYVGMEPSCLDRYPHELSGGMRQRVAIARALAMEPELLVADEPIASLDVLIQAQIVNLFRHLQKEHGFSFLFIAHDLAMVQYLCDRVGVMYRGKIVETGSVRDVFQNPRHPYTKALLASAPVLKRGRFEKEE